MNPLEQLEFTTRVAKRAQYEAFEFALTPKGVSVRNCSHANPADHEYLVTISDGLPSACTCPADERFDGACKHRIAVAIREPLLDAARAEQMAADGGTATSPSDDGMDMTDPDASDNTCDCSALSDDFPCWECVRTGRRSLPD
ncbi:SWIM zinc finger family protein [Halorientalis marina]|uniref:SWIM zinc finger family protein n=1 Tax=Halorientalis marina TaxID=2931976 RepID=UPI001FF39943|nr:SWIM zinc finger family protein [Halorientalis marina]